MKIYFQPDNSEEWFHGTIVSRAKMVYYFVGKNKDNSVEDITLSNVEISFSGSGFNVTGFCFESRSKGNYKLISVDCRLTKPKVKT